MTTKKHRVSIPGGDAEKRFSLRFCPGKHTGDRKNLPGDESRLTGGESRLTGNETRLTGGRGS
ncbi:MAG: hypothetical protein LBR10_02040, partial [Prevotellaceae bacterium]|nr:hypothetical protein [Prevotellaceae bacterium]